MPCKHPAITLTLAESRHGPWSLGLPPTGTERKNTTPFPARTSHALASNPGFQLRPRQNDSYGGFQLPSVDHSQGWFWEGGAGRRKPDGLPPKYTSGLSLCLVHPMPSMPHRSGQEVTWGRPTLRVKGKVGRAIFGGEVNTFKRLVWGKPQIPGTNLYQFSLQNSTCINIDLTLFTLFTLFR